MKFSEMKYQRPNLDEFRIHFMARLGELSATQDADQEIRVISEINALRNEYSTMSTLCHIRHTLNTQDPFYKEEQQFFDQATATLLDLEKRFYESVLASTSRTAIARQFGEQWIRIAEHSTQCFQPNMANEVAIEKELSTEYTALIASSQIIFWGETLTLAQKGKYLGSSDRATRKAANDAKYGFRMGTSHSFLPILMERQTRCDDLVGRHR